MSFERLGLDLRRGVVGVLLAGISGFLTKVSLAGAAERGPMVSIVSDANPAAPAAHGMAKIVTALESKGVSFERVDSAQMAGGTNLLLVGLATTAKGPAAEVFSRLKLQPPESKESLMIRVAPVGGKPTVLITGGDARGLMYGELDVADRIGWANDPAKPFESVHDIVESPDAPQRAISMYTMNRAYLESRFYDEKYWERYFDLMAANRFNSFVMIFGYENGGFLAPPYPYFFDTDGFETIRMIGITPDQQQKNLAALNHLITMAHDRGIEVTLGIWDHIYRGGVQANGTPGSEDALKKPTQHLVWGVTAENLIPYTKAALSKFLKLVPEVDAIQFRMHDESGLKNSEQVGFWHDVFAMLKQQSPRLRFDLRAKGLPDSVIDDAVASGIHFRITTKYWMEQMGLPFHPTHINVQDQKNRRHGYADLLRYPQQYPMHWRLWNGGPARVMLWGDPEYARRFVESTHLYNGDGFEINEPLCTKMQAQAHDAKPFELLNPKYRYYDYEFERYWHLFQVFGRIGYNPNTPPEVFSHEFERRFGPDAGPFIEKSLHHASQVLPRIVAACYPYSAFPMTRGWAERQALGDLPKYATSEGSDIAQFASFAEEAQNLLEGKETAKIRPGRTSEWFLLTSFLIEGEASEAEKRIGNRRDKEFDVTMTDLKMLAKLARFHAVRIPGAVAYNLYKRTGDQTALDAANEYERDAIDVWKQLVAATGDVYTDDLAFGNRRPDLCGHWRDELPMLEAGLAKLARERQAAKPDPASNAIKLLKSAFEHPADIPKVQHKAITRAEANVPLTFMLTATSPAGIKWIRLRYRAVNQTLDYESLPMLQGAEADVYQCTIPAEKISPRFDLMYYIEVMDNAGRGRIYPDLETQTPYLIVKLH